MNLREAYKYTTAYMKSGSAVAWISPPGLGKTDTMRKLIAWMKKSYPGKRLGVAIIFMATQSPIGFTGLPWKGLLEYGGTQYTVTDPAIPQWYLAHDVETGELAPADKFDRVLLIVEEWGQGDLDTKKTAADLLLHGAVGKWRLPPGSFRIALSNNDARDGVTKEFDFVINRRCQLTIEGDVDVWLEDFADRPQEDGSTIMPVTKAWAKHNSQVLFEPKPKEQGPWCTPRSITMWDRFTQVVIEDGNGVIPYEDPAYIQATAGMIGMPATKSILDACRFTLDLPTKEQVVKDPTGTEIPTRPDLLMLMMYELAARTKPDEIGPVLQYVSRVKMVSMHITFVTAMLKRDYKGIIDHPAMKAWISKNAQIVAKVGGLSH